MTIDTMKYWNALRGVSQNGGMVSVDAAGVCISLAVREVDDVYREALATADKRIDAMTEELENLQTDTEREVAGLRRQIAERDDMITAGRAENRQLLERISELTARLGSVNDAAIATYRVANENLAARARELTAQLEAANSRPVTLVAHNGTGTPATAASDTPADIHWSDLPAEYHADITGLLAGKARWTDLPVATRRSIALYAIARLATDGVLTLAAFESSKPAFMPSGQAIAQMFGIRWSQVVENAVTHARVG